MLGFLARTTIKVAVAAGVGVAAAAVWKKYDLGTKVTELADRALTAFVVGDGQQATADFPDKASGRAHVPGQNERLADDDLVAGYGTTAGR
jgi:hypothetical protein